MLVDGCVAIFQAAAGLSEMTFSFLSGSSLCCFFRNKVKSEFLFFLQHFISLFWINASVLFVSCDLFPFTSSLSACHREPAFSSSEI